MNRGSFLIILLLTSVCVSQTKKTIDSINHIKYETIVEKNIKFYSLFMKNASDSKKIKYKLGEAESYSNLSLVSFYGGKFEDNLKYSLLAIDLFEQIGDKEKLAKEYGEMGYRMKTRNSQKAVYYMQKGMKISEKYHYKKPLLSIYNNYGILKKLQNETDSALYFFDKCLKLKERIKDSVGIPYSLNNIGEIYMERKQFKEAKELFDKALLIRYKLNDKYGIADNYAYLGDLLHAQKKYTEAIVYYNKSLEVSSKYGFKNLLQHNNRMISECYEYANNSKAALVSYKKYVYYKDSILNTETNAKIAELEVKFETNKKEKQLLEKEIQIKNTRNGLIGVVLLAFFIGLIGFLIYRQQKLKNKQQEQEFQLKSAIAAIESQNQLQEQRLSISRDLHDNIGAQLTFVISSVDNLKYGNQITDSKITNQLTKISDFTKSTIIELRDTIWAMNTNEFTFEDLKSRIFNFIEKAKTAKENIQFHFNVDDTLKNQKFSSIVGINLYRTIQEAVNNALKYSEADEITVKVASQNNKIQIEIQDNGNGFNLDKVAFGNGLNNMVKRIEEIGGVCEVRTQEKKGTTIYIVINKTQ